MSSKNYGIVSSIALDPIEKKPLYHFYPGSSILSVGSLGCNMDCPFCQNHQISHPTDAIDERYISPESLLSLAIHYSVQGNIGVAFTYNEPLMSYDYICDVGKLLHENDLKTVVVTNGCFGDKVIDAILPVVDAMNIDLKGFRPEIYETLGGNLHTVKNFINRTHKDIHIELTSLIVPGLNDSIEDMHKQAQWIASLSPSIPLHITRFFPRYQMLDSNPTEISIMEDLAQVAKEYLDNVYLGNI